MWLPWWPAQPAEPPAPDDLSLLLHRAAAPFGVRQNNIVITQTITRQFTTITTFVTLGPGPGTIATAAETTPDPAPTAVPTDTGSGATPGSTNTASSSSIYGGSGSLSSSQIFGILGGVIGFIVVVLLIWYFLRVGNARRRYEYYSADSSEYTSGSSSVTEVRKRPPRRPRDPWARDPRRRPPAGPAGPRVPQAAYRPAYDLNRMDMPNIAFSGVRRTV